MPMSLPVGCRPSGSVKIGAVSVASPVRQVTKLPRKDIVSLLSNGEEIDRAVEDAVRDAVQHKRAGNPVAVSRDGKVVWLTPDQIPS